MARTPSNMLALGTKAPDFSLPNTVDSKTHSFDKISGTRGTVVMFICNHCPYVIHVMEGITALAKDYQNNGIGFVAISSNDVVNYPGLIEWNYWYILKKNIPRNKNYFWE